MKHITTTVLTDLQQTLINNLVNDCRTHDHIRLSYPLDEKGEDCFHAMLCDENNRPVAVLALLLYPGDYAECTAFTHPAHRRKGYFQQLFSLVLPRFEDYDILFGVTDDCIDALAVLHSMEAEPETREHRMERHLDSGLSALAPVHKNAKLSAGTKEDAACIWQLSDGGTLVGSCHTIPVSDDSVCLHHVEILEPFRNQRYGTDLLTLLLLQLQHNEIRSIILQVSDKNHAALSLYKKTGFLLTETLSYYLY